MWYVVQTVDVYNVVQYKYTSSFVVLNTKYVFIYIYIYSIYIFMIRTHGILILVLEYW